MGSDFEHSETGNWNLSSPYVEDIARLMREANEYKEIAMFGFTDIILDLNTKNKDKTLIRRRALEKYIYKLRDIVMYCHFAIKNKNDKDKFLEYKEILTKIRNNDLKKIIIQKQDGDKFFEIIDESLFNLVFGQIEEIDMNMREPMNQADLIFQHKEVFNAKEFKNKIKDSFIGEG